MIKKISLLFCSVLLFCSLASARHIKGGWVQYEYVSAGATAGTSMYKITVYVFRDCIQSGPMPSALGIYDAATFKNVQTITGTAISYKLINSATKNSFDPCLSNPPVICYQTFAYTTTVTLPDNANGYIIAAQDANRISGIVNITNSVSTGISFTAIIPGTINGKDYHVNTSPYFNFKDTAIICYNAKFNYQFTATDTDGDTLTYSLGDGINGASNLTSPPYSSLIYTSGFSGKFPLGNTVSIDSLSGLVSGTAPATTGEYIIAVYVHEWRNGIIINSTKKELEITVGNCSLSVASLKPAYINCDNYTFSFQNETTASNITSYLWDFGVNNSVTDISTSATPSFTYADTGKYTVKLVVGNANGCKDSASAPVKVYPGFTPSFTVSGSCFQSPLFFTDNSFVKYGSINSWAWDLGDSTTTSDTFSIRNPTYQYTHPGNVSVVMTVSSTVGCTGSFTKIITVNDKPFISLAFMDTLICSIDTLPLKAQGSGTYKWTPDYRISNTGIINPVVYPRDTTVYTLTVTDHGCIDSAKVKVNVLQFIKVTLGLDSGICRTDSFTLRPVSDALSYKWRASTNANSLSSYSVKYPVASPMVSTTYYVTGNLGYCQDSSKVTIYVSPYPVAKLGNDTTLCFGSRLQLTGIFMGAFFTWSPSASLINTNTVQPIAGPVRTTSYVFIARDTLYCPKTVSDTILIKVIPPVSINAGRDTTISPGQALQLMASGSDPSYQYYWTPGSYLNNSSIYNPIATISSSAGDSIVYFVQVTTPEGCTASDDLKVRIYRNGPEILVPNAFTPNGDGKNDVIRPILIGISQFNFFTVYNRWGQVLFTTAERDKGWDGSFKGALQASGTYIYTAQGQDYTGKIIYRKGTVVLIR